MLPKIYYVTGSGRATRGDFLWPGFGENSACCSGCSTLRGNREGDRDPIGNLPPTARSILDGLDLSAEDLRELLRVDVDGWLSELPMIREYYEQFGDRLPNSSWPSGRDARAVEAAKS